MEQQEFDFGDPVQLRVAFRMTPAEYFARNSQLEPEYTTQFEIGDILRSAYSPLADITPGVGDYRAAERGNQFFSQAQQGPVGERTLNALAGVGEYATTIPGIGDIVALTKGLGTLAGLAGTTKWWHGGPGALQHPQDVNTPFFTSGDRTIASDYAEGTPGNFVGSYEISGNQLSLDTPEGLRELRDIGDLFGVHALQGQDNLNLKPNQVAWPLDLLYDENVQKELLRRGYTGAKGTEPYGIDQVPINVVLDPSILGRAQMSQQLPLGLVGGADAQELSNAKKVAQKIFGSQLQDTSIQRVYAFKRGSGKAYAAHYQPEGVPMSDRISMWGDTPEEAQENLVKYLFDLKEDPFKNYKPRDLGGPVFK